MGTQPNILQEGHAEVEAARRAWTTRRVVYLRGTEQYAFNATYGEVGSEELDESGNLSRAETRDFLFNTSDLSVSGVEFLPETGDQIWIQDDRLADYYYEVISDYRGPSREWSDPYRETVRVHTKLVRFVEPSS